MPGRHSEMITQLLHHVTSSPHNAEVKGDIFRRNYLPSKSRYHSFNILGVTEEGGGGMSPPPVVEDQIKPGLNRVKWITNL